jgi:hypothetical protein
VLAISETKGSLVLVFETHLLSALASIELYQSSTTSATVAWMLSFTELIELSNHILQILCIVVSKHHSELLLHLL